MHYKSVFSNAEYFPIIENLKNILTIEAYEKWRKEIIMKKLMEIKMAQEAEQNKYLEEEIGEEETEEGEVEDDDKVVEVEERGSSNSSLSNKVLENNIKETISNQTEELDNFLDHALHSTFRESTREEEEEEQDEVDEYGVQIEFYEQQLAKEYFTLDSLLVERKFSYYEPNIQLIFELMTTKPKKKYQQRESAVDFMLMVDNPDLFEPNFTEPSTSVDEEVDILIEKTRRIHQLYKYRPPFHPTQLGLDQFTVEQQGFPGDFSPAALTDPQHVGDQLVLSLNL